VGEIIESYQDSLEREIARWNGFARALRKDDREAFEELMNMGRNHAFEIRNTSQTTIFEPMVISILTAQSCQIRKLQEELNAIQPSPSLPTEEEKLSVESPKPVAVYLKKKKPGGEQTRLS
jgi:hypothetical protein